MRDAIVHGTYMSRVLPDTYVTPFVFDLNERKWLVRNTENDFTEKSFKKKNFFTAKNGD
tara:strand:+ start:515 stop:691 length:177 start_codon:yes stop_codon:yes gene_type:complete